MGRSGRPCAWRQKLPRLRGAELTKLRSTLLGVRAAPLTGWVCSRTLRPAKHGLDLFDLFDLFDVRPNGSLHPVGSKSRPVTGKGREPARCMHATARPDDQGRAIVQCDRSYPAARSRSPCSPGRSGPDRHSRFQIHDVEPGTGARDGEHLVEQQVARWVERLPAHGTVAPLRPLNSAVVSVPIRRPSAAVALWKAASAPSASTCRSTSVASAHSCARAQSG